MRVSRVVVSAAALAAGLVLGAGAGLAEPAPPTSGGNGAGQSGQCTGPQVDRPESCKSQGGPGDPQR